MKHIATYNEDGYPTETVKGTIVNVGSCKKLKSGRVIQLVEIELAGDHKPTKSVDRYIRLSS